MTVWMCLCWEATWTLLPAAMPHNLPLMHPGLCQNGLGPCCATCHHPPASRLTTSPATDTKAQPQLDCNHTTRISSCAIHIDTKNSEAITSLTFNYLYLKHKSNAWADIGMGELLVIEIVNDAITRTQQIGCPLKGNLGTLL